MTYLCICLPHRKKKSAILSLSRSTILLLILLVLLLENTQSKSMIKSKSKEKAIRKDNTFLNLELLRKNIRHSPVPVLRLDSMIELDIDLIY
jgi:hypothetical protein